MAELGARSEVQGTESVDPEFLTNENQLVQSMGSWDAESHHVCHRDLVTVGAVYPETEIDGPVLGTLGQATVDADQVTEYLGPVTGDVRSLVAAGIHGYPCPRVGTDDYSDPESSNTRRRIAPPVGQATEPWIPGRLIPRPATRRLSTEELIHTSSSRGGSIPALRLLSPQLARQS